MLSTSVYCRDMKSYAHEWLLSAVYCPRIRVFVLGMLLYFLPQSRSVAYGIFVGIIRWLSLGSS